MSEQRGWFISVLTILVLTANLLCNGGCASKPKVDWNQRIGNCTFDQVVQEMGPPVASTLLGDGTRVAEWFLKPGPQLSFGLGTGFSSGGAGVGVGQSVGIPTPGHYLRLTFAPEGQLQRWEKVRH